MTKAFYRVRQTDVLQLQETNEPKSTLMYKVHLTTGQIKVNVRIRQMHWVRTYSILLWIN